MGTHYKSHLELTRFLFISILVVSLSCIAIPIILDLKYLTTLIGMLPLSHIVSILILAAFAAFEGMGQEALLLVVVFLSIFVFMILSLTLAYLKSPKWITVMYAILFIDIAIGFIGLIANLITKIDVRNIIGIALDLGIVIATRHMLKLRY